MSRKNPEKGRLFSASLPGALTNVALALMMFTWCASSAAASTITWEDDLQVHGTAVGVPPGFALPAPTMVVPVGTPMKINLSFDSNTPNDCSSQRGGSISSVSAAAVVTLRRSISLDINTVQLAASKWDLRPAKGRAQSQACDSSWGSRPGVFKSIRLDSCCSGSRNQLTATCSSRDQSHRD